MTAASGRRTSARRAYDTLARSDEGLARLIAEHGRPDPFRWSLLDDEVGDDAFAELVLHVVSQQISTRAALTIYGRLRDLLGGVVAAAPIAERTEEDLRAVGLSGAKARSVLDLAERVLDGRVDFERLARSEDAAAQAELERVRGVGPWSAQMFLLHHLRRPDIFPAADVGLLRAAQGAFGLAARPTAADLTERAERWRPYRAYGAALLWAHAHAALMA